MSGFNYENVLPDYSALTKPAISKDLMDILNEESANKSLANKIAVHTVASEVAEQIYEETIAFQKSLSNNFDVAFQIVQFGSQHIIFVDTIGYIGYNLVVFNGTDQSGNSVRLIQHISQLSFLLMATKKEPEVEKRTIGFDCT